MSTPKLNAVSGIERDNRAFNLHLWPAFIKAMNQVGVHLLNRRRTHDNDAVGVDIGRNGCAFAMHG